MKDLSAGCFLNIPGKVLLHRKSIAGAPAIEFVGLKLSQSLRAFVIP
jgi:hypothetical protein